VKVKQDCKLEVRIPEWVKPEEVACDVKRRPRQLSFQGRYADVGSVSRGETAALTFPIYERTVQQSIGGAPYTLIIKGNEVVFIDPPGQHWPLYQRAHYRENQTRWRKLSRFVADKRIAW